MRLNEDNFLLYATKHYNNHGSLSQDEFESDLKIFIYINKQIGKKDGNYHLTLNHIITLFNIFDKAALYLLLYKVEEQYWNKLFTYLVFINRMPDKIPEYEIEAINYPLDNELIDKLRKI